MRSIQCHGWAGRISHRQGQPRGAPKVRDSVVLVTNVIQVYDLEASVPQTNLELHPGESFQLDTVIENTGNGPDRYDIAVNSIVDSNGASAVWDIEIPQ